MGIIDKENLEKIKGFFTKKNKEQNLVLLLLLLIILFVASKYILNKDEKEVNVQTVQTYSSAVETSNSIEARLEQILSKIDCIEEVNVMVTYANTNKTIPVYDVKEDIDTAESQNNKTTKSVTEKTVAYQENNGDKVPIVESTENADLVGAIVVAKGQITSDLVLEIKNAVAVVCEIPVYKVMVFHE